MKKVIAIDGPVAAGKTVVGREVARRLGYKYLDTGIMYRAITWLALRQEVPIEDGESLGKLACANPVRLNGTDCHSVVIGEQLVGPELRRPEVDRHVSLVSQLSPVRRAMVKQQRALARQGAIVMVGRDIGTVVLPDAALKVFMSASAEERARRRWLERVQRGEAAEYSQVLQETRERDHLDSTRSDSPLLAADDAFLVDTEGLNIEQVVEVILEEVRRRCGSHSP